MKIMVKAALLSAGTITSTDLHSAYAESHSGDPYELYREMTLDCGGGTTMDDEILECVGRASEACATNVADEKQDHLSPDRYLNCLRAENEAWEWLMDTEIEPAFTQVGFWFTADALEREHLQRKFQAEQESWKQYRDISCDLARDLRAPPSTTEGEEAYLECMQRRNAERYVVLMNLSDAQ